MKKVKFNQNWTFFRNGGSALAALAGGGAMGGEAVTLPHDASVLTTRNPEEPNGSGNGFFREECVHYTKDFEMDAADADKNVWLEFEGVYQNAFVYINGAFAGKCPYGYSNFYVDATKYLRFGQKNSLKVIVKNGVPSGRWYTGGGIYRDVNLMIADRLHIVPDGVQLAAIEIEEDQAIVRVKTEIEYTGTGVRDTELHIQLLDTDGIVVAEDMMPVTVEQGMKQVYQQKIYVENPILWDLENSYLYSYRAWLEEQGTEMDEETGTFGIRKLQLDTKHGLRINGKEVNLRGGCIHHDNGITGTAEFPHAAEFRVKKLKEAGFNAIRSSHYPMSRRLLEACDTYGMLVMDEFSDVWTTTKVDFDYGMHMSDWWEHDIANLVRKDYNHPCVIMYSIGNEIPETGNKFDTQWGKKLADRLRELDDSRYVTNSLNLMLSIMDRLGELMEAMMSGGQVPEAEKEAAEAPVEINSAMSSLGEIMDMVIAGEVAGKATEESFAQVDIAGYNYATCRYEQDLKTYPNRIIVGSETYSQDLDKNWALVEKYPAIIGDFSWTAYDYLGEAGIGKITYGAPQGMSFYAEYPYKAAYCGELNLLGDRRPVSYWRELIWGLRQAPYISVQPPQYYGVQHSMTNWSMSNAVRSWNWKGYEGKPAVVEVYADADEAALYINGELVEKKAVGEKKKFIAMFDIIYTPGKIEAVAYKDGVEVGRDYIQTARDEVQMKAYADAEQIPADGSDICYVEIRMEDAEGILNTEAEVPVTVSVDGGVIAGFGSAAPASEENYYDMTAKPFEGRLRAAVRGNGTVGTITVKLHADGCEEAVVQIKAV